MNQQSYTNHKFTCTSEYILTIVPLDDPLMQDPAFTKFLYMDQGNWQPHILVYEGTQDFGNYILPGLPLSDDQKNAIKWIVDVDLGTLWLDLGDYPEIYTAIKTSTNNKNLLDFGTMGEALSQATAIAGCIYRGIVASYTRLKDAEELEKQEHVG